MPKEIILNEAGKLAIWDGWSNTRRLASGNSSAELASPSSIGGDYVCSVTISSGLIKVVFAAPKSNSAIQSDTLLLSPITAAGA